MYKSPVEIIYGQMQTQLEGDIFRAVQSYDIKVDKEELIRALNYDREQYNKGYLDGKADAMAEIVRCKDCKHYVKRMMLCQHEYGMDTPNKMDFCSCGERRTDDERKAD